MNTPTYKEQFDKLTEAYIMGEVDATNACACFVGNLLNGNKEWFNFVNNGIIHNQSAALRVLKTFWGGFYTPEEIRDLEALFMYEVDGGENGHWTENEEEYLFIAFEKTLALLKQIHISKGEIIDDVPVFKKRPVTSY